MILSLVERPSSF